MIPTNNLDDSISAPLSVNDDTQPSTIPKDVLPPPLARPPTLKRHRRRVFVIVAFVCITVVIAIVVVVSVVTKRDRNNNTMSRLTLKFMGMEEVWSKETQQVLEQACQDLVYNRLSISQISSSCNVESQAVVAGTASGQLGTLNSTQVVLVVTYQETNESRLDPQQDLEQRFQFSSLELVQILQKADPVFFESLTNIVVVTSSINSINLSPFSILYTVKLTSLPSSHDISEVKKFTSQYIYANIRKEISSNALNWTLISVTTETVGSDHRRTAGTIRIDYIPNIYYDSTSTLPESAKLETLLRTYFIGKNANNYVQEMKATLSTTNVFISTLSVLFLDMESEPSRTPAFVYMPSSVPTSSVVDLTFPTSEPTAGPCRVCRDLDHVVGNPTGLVRFNTTVTWTCAEAEQNEIPTDRCFTVQAFAAVTCGCQPMNVSMATSFPTNDEIVWNEARNNLEDRLGDSLDSTFYRPYLDAFQWMRTQDPMRLTPDDTFFLQRTFTASIYFATATSQAPWLFCNPPILPNEDDTCIYKKVITLDPVSTIDVPWIRFLTNRSECDWVGVICDQNGYVNALDFSGLNISSHIPDGIHQFQSLKSLAMDFNLLSGTIPESFGSLSDLTTLSLSHNKLTGTIPVSIFSLHSLQRLNLANNTLIGTISPGINFVSNLTTLVLSENELYGILPASIDNLRSLQFLRLDSNKFQGRLPFDMTLLTLLNDLWLQDNRLSGSIIFEDSIATHPLKDLRLSQNNFSGTIPDSVYKLTDLFRIELSQNAFQGTLSSSISALTYLSILELASNGIGATIPSTIGSLPKLSHINLSGNSFSGIVPTEIGSLTSLQTLDLSSNILVGTVPTEIALLYALRAFRINDNNMTGNFPSILCPVFRNIDDTYIDCVKLAGASECSTWCCSDALDCVCMYNTTNPLRCTA